MATTTSPPPAAAHPGAVERVLTFGGVFGRDAGGLIVLLVLFGAMTLAVQQFLTDDTWRISPARWRSSGSSRSVSCS